MMNGICRGRRAFASAGGATELTWAIGPPYPSPPSLPRRIDKASGGLLPQGQRRGRFVFPCLLEERGYPLLGADLADSRAPLPLGARVGPRGLRLPARGRHGGA